MAIAFILTIILAVLVVCVVWLFVGRYKRCPSNQILVIFGKTGQGAAKCIHGGAAFVWPVLQSYSWLNLEIGRASCRERV